MNGKESQPEGPSGPLDEPPPALEEATATLQAYLAALKGFDAALCEAIAVGQGSSGRYSEPYIGHASRVFARLCAHGIAIVRACPRTRWVRADAENWDFGSIAGHMRSIMEGRLLFNYIAKRPVSSDEWAARLNVMHLNDCTRRIRILRTVVDEKEIQGLEEQAEELRNRLRSNTWFLKIDAKLQKKLLTGELLTISSRSEQLKEIGMTTDGFYFMFDFLSQYAHVLPLSFYRMEPNGRGTGLENETDRGYFRIALLGCTEMIEACTTRMVELFPDTAELRQGSDSKFSPGPRRNLPKHVKRRG